MAKQAGIIKITGTIDDITFYVIGGIYYARMKSSLTGKRFWKDMAFEGSRKSAIALGKASPMASRLYHTLPKEIKSRTLFCKLTGEIKFLITAGHTEQEIISWFLSVYHDACLVITNEVSGNDNTYKKAYYLPPAQLDSCLATMNVTPVITRRISILKE
ncbi:MAG TPA: hypothetical protein VGD26_10460 [Chitinophagaceae bacterium]